MKGRKLARPLAESCRGFCHNLVDGVSLRRGALRLRTTATTALTPHLELLQRAENPESCTVFEDGEISGIARRNSRVFGISSTFAVRKCHGAIVRHSAVWEKSRSYSASANNAGPAPVNPSTLLDEELFHELADDILHQLQEKIEILGEDLNVDGFDSDYSSGVLTIRLGQLGTYVINKQTPNRQIWLSSPVSGPGRYDWVESEKGWVYRRTKAELVSLLEKEFSQLLNTSVSLS
ncbi:hypothetical protein R1sor_016973 [Riccia sorocarpa]|uniref:ferroxidase n=1 Tax=Riccia sorocarpa TaxID=122646 RepID=A0ABD3I9G2_9MARC